MIFVQGWIRIASKDVDDIIPAARVMMMETNEEPGCLHYSFAKDVVENNLIHISERWDCEDNLKAHFQTPHMAEFNAAMSEVTIVSADIRMYSGDEVKVMMQS